MRAPPLRLGARPLLRPGAVLGPRRWPAPAVPGEGRMVWPGIPAALVLIWGLEQYPASCALRLLLICLLLCLGAAAFCVTLLCYVYEYPISGVLDFELCPGLGAP